MENSVEIKNYIEKVKFKDSPFVKRKLAYFKYDHLPEHLQERSKIFHDAAYKMLEMEPVDISEAIIALNNLIAAKDAFVRSFIK